MPKIHYVRRANKTKRKHGIRKGAEYWWWYCRPSGKLRGLKMYSPTPPKNSQLTLSPGKRSYWRAIEDAEHWCSLDTDNLPGVIEGLKNCVALLEETAQSQREKIDAMPAHLQSSPIHDKIRVIVEMCDDACDKITVGVSRLESGMYTPEELVEVMSEILASLRLTESV